MLQEGTTRGFEGCADHHEVSGIAALARLEVQWRARSHQNISHNGGWAEEQYIAKYGACRGALFENAEYSDVLIVASS